MDTSDGHLVKLAQAGDSTAFGHLLERHYGLIHALAFRLLGNKADAEDLAQDICAALPAKLKRFRGDAKFSTWLYRVTTNAALDRLRARNARNRAADGWGAAEVLRRAANDDQRRELDWLQTAMGQLGPDLRATVALVLGQDMTHAQAAEVLNLSEGTVSWRMSEVKKALRQIAKREERI